MGKYLYKLWWGLLVIIAILIITCLLAWGAISKVIFNITGWKWFRDQSILWDWEDTEMRDYDDR